MIDIMILLPELKKLVTELSEDLLARTTSDSGIDAGLRNAYTQIEKGGRTGDPYEVWLEDYLDQVAVAWVLSCVFVRFMEDNDLIDQCWLAGQGERRQKAEDSHELYFRENPRNSDRDYFEHVFRKVGKIPACHDLFAEGKTPLWAVGPSGDAAMKLLAYWREIDTDSGQLKRTFGVSEGDTRFLGDLYQDLSERARKKYALLQTPVFVEEFILDRTLDPAVDEFGVDEVRMIDPTCGSGHFLLGGFSRLFDLWIKRENNDIVAAQKALDGVWGCDINPFAVAIARFRLIVAALRACGIKSLKKAPAWNIHLATGDSLLFGTRWDRDGKQKDEQQFFGTDEESWAPDIYACEDKDAIKLVLGQQYHAVVGNPPYVTPKDRASRDEYRRKYRSAYSKYHLSTPFTERFFELALSTVSGTTKVAGYVGLIKDNAFMKREFGKALITEFFPTVALTHVIDTSGAYIPGHGTPTVILFGRNRNPSGAAVRAVMGIRGGPTPDVPEEGVVWCSIVEHLDDNGWENEWVSVADVPRSKFNKHPWSVAGGGASELQQSIEDASKYTLNDLVKACGVFGMTNANDVFLAEASVLERNGVDSQWIVEARLGDELRDWTTETFNHSLFPYNPTSKKLLEPSTKGTKLWLWRVRTILGNRATFNKATYFQEGLPWWKWHQVSLDRLSPPLTINYSEIATHNHFALNRGGNVFTQTAPIIKLRSDATEDEHLGLIGLLNCSVTCFWLKQFAHNKGDSTDQKGARTTGDPAFNTYAFNSTLVGKVPLPEQRPTRFAERLSHLGEAYSKLAHVDWDEQAIPSDDELIKVGEEQERLRQEMIFLQEELDWLCYNFYGLTDEPLIFDEDNVIPIRAGLRAFEFILACRITKGTSQSEWFSRHGWQMHTEFPDNWPEGYATLVRRRMEAIQSCPQLKLLEHPVCKRRWNDEAWEVRKRKAARRLLLRRLESPLYFAPRGDSKAQLRSISAIADIARTDGKFLRAAEVFAGRSDFELLEFIEKLVVSDSVPVLPIFTFKPSGIRKYMLWEKTWAQQKDEDQKGEFLYLNSPPSFAKSDYRSDLFWQLRGELNLPRQRFNSFPFCETEGDPTLVVGWAGWDHVQQATAIVAYYDARKREGWTAERLTPMLAALDQLMPWIHQWHPEIDPEYNESAGDSFQTLLKSEAQELGLTLEQIRNWTPPAKTRAAKKSAAKQPKQPRKKKSKAEVDE